MEGSISEKNIIKVEQWNNVKVHIDEVRHVECKSLNIDEQRISKTDDEKTCHENNQEKIVVLCTEIAIEYPQSAKIRPEFAESNFELIKNGEKLKNEPETMKTNSKLEIPDKVSNKGDMDFDSKMDNVGYIYTGAPAGKFDYTHPSSRFSDRTLLLFIYFLLWVCWQKTL